MTGDETIKILKEYQKTHPETAHYKIGPDTSKGFTKEICEEILDMIHTRFPDSRKIITYNGKLNRNN